MSSGPTTVLLVASPGAVQPIRSELANDLDVVHVETDEQAINALGDRQFEVALLQEDGAGDSLVLLTQVKRVQPECCVVLFGERPDVEVITEKKEDEE